MKTKKTTTPHLQKSIGRSPLRRAFLLIAVALACFALWTAPKAFGIPPQPDGDAAGSIGNTAEGCGALQSLPGRPTLSATLYGGPDNTAIGFRTLFHNIYGRKNTAVGGGALSDNIVGYDNTAIGVGALFYLSPKHYLEGGQNTAIGYNALRFDIDGGGNTAIGVDALADNTDGSGNIALGAGAGNVTTGSANIDIDNHGVAGESATIRIGSADQTRTFIVGIAGAAVTGASVVVNAHGELGTVPSSKRFKEDIKPIDKTSEALFALTPVAFHYKREIDPTGTSQFGLVAEEVEKVNPDLVVHDKEGKPYSVRYDQVNAMLLNEFLKEHRKVENLEANAARKQKQIEALTTGLQKVSAQFEASNPAPQVVNNP